MGQQLDPDFPVRLGIDFGECMTVIAVGDTGRDYPTVRLPGISRSSPGTTTGSVVHRIPSIIRYEGGCIKSIGEEVVCEGREPDPSVIRWMRRYLFDNSPVQVPAGNDRMVRYGDAAGEFLAAVLSRVMTQYPKGADLIFSLPADAPNEYANWLDRTGRTAGARSCSWVNECAAAAIGYGISPAAGKPFVVLAFSETEILATAVVPEGPETGDVMGGMRTLGRASVSTGCHAVDTWIVQDLLARFRLQESEPRAERIRPILYREAERARERIPLEGLAGIAVTDPVQGRTYTARYGRAELGRVLVEHGVITAVQQVLNRVLSALRARGTDESGIVAVLLTGAGCALPGVQECIRERLPGVPVHANHLLDAVARGAAACTAPARAPDRITGSYALRYWDPVTQEHHYRFIVQSGAPFPSEGQVARIIISAAYDGQTHLGIPLCEIAGGGKKACGIELVSDWAGGVRIAGPAQDIGLTSEPLMVNEYTPTLLEAEPPAKKGEPRFECTFTINQERYLCLSASDLVTGVLVKLNAPVYQLK
jgi:molecular chaperone DnaK